MLKVVALPRRAVADAKDHGITAALGALRSTNAVCGASSVRRCASVQAVQSRPSGGQVMTIRAQIQIQMLRCGCCSLSQRHSSPAKCEKLNRLAEELFAVIVACSTGSFHRFRNDSDYQRFE